MASTQLQPTLDPRIALVGEGRLYVMQGMTGEFLVGNGETGHVSISHWKVQPGGGVPTHIHEREHETWLITGGTFKITVAEAEYVVGPGAIVFGPQGIPHSFFNVGESEGSFYLLVSNDNFEAFIAAWCEEGPSEETMAKFGLTMVAPAP